MIIPPHGHEKRRSERPTLNHRCALYNSLSLGRPRGTIIPRLLINKRLHKVLNKWTSNCITAPARRLWHFPNSLSPVILGFGSLAWVRQRGNPRHTAGCAPGRDRCQRGRSARAVGAASAGAIGLGQRCFAHLFGSAGGPERGRQHLQRLLGAVSLGDYVARVVAGRTAAQEGLPLVRAAIAFEGWPHLRTVLCAMR